MDDSAYGTDDRRGNWVPTAPISYGPAFQWPPQPAALFKWVFGFPGYLLPGNTLYAIGALVIWRYLTPSLEVMRNFEPGWMGLILLRSCWLISSSCSWCLLNSSRGLQGLNSSRGLISCSISLHGGSLHKASTRGLSVC
jgi:hypothetical protein